MSNSHAEFKGKFSTTLRDIENSTLSCSNVVKQLGQLKKLQELGDALQTRLADHNDKIESLCSHQYQGFVESIHELLHVQQEALSLQEKLCSTSSRVTEVSHAFNTTYLKLIKCKQSLKNLHVAKECLQLCLPVLDTYAKLQQQIKEERYYHALKTLEHLEHNMLPMIGSYIFVEAIKLQIPQIRNKIRTASENELKDYLVGVRGDKSRLIGAIAIRQVSEQVGLNKSLIFSVQNRKIPSVISPTTNPFDDVSEHEELMSGGTVATDDTIEDLIDFSPVYRCMNIHAVMGQKNKFEQYYRNQRSYQCSSMLQLSPQQTRMNYNEFFTQFVGFFVIEDHLHHTMPDMVTRKYLDELWDNAHDILTRFIDQRLPKLTETDSLLELKKYFLLLSVSMNSYGYNINFINDIIKRIQNYYNKLLLANYRPKFCHIFDEDNYTAMEFQDDEEFMNQVFNLYPYSPVEFTRMPYPKKISFSHMVPLIYHTCVEFAEECLHFCDNLDFSLIELEDSLSKTLNDLFASIIRECFKDKLKQLGLLELIQMIVNLDALEEVCEKLEDHVMRRLDSSGVKLHGKAVFKDCQSETESYAYDKMKTQVDTMMGLADYDWEFDTPVSSTHTNDGNSKGGASKPSASQWIRDLLSYFNSIFAAHTNLPPKVAQTACLISCKHIHEKLMKLVFDPQIKSISYGAIEQLNADIDHCKLFATSTPVAGLEPETLSMAFEELSQLLSLVLQSDWAVYLVEFHSSNKRKYDRVTVSKAIQLLERVREHERRKGSFFSNIRSRQRKETEQVLKQLRVLVPGQVSH